MSDNKTPEQGGAEHERLRKAAVDMELGGETLQLIDARRQTKPVLQELLAVGKGADAVALAARLLPKAYAVAWVCRCARSGPLDEECKAAVAVAERWLRQPSEENRGRAADFAAAAQYKTAGAWIAATPGWSGGSLSPAGQPTVPPAAHLTARAASAALVMLATQTPPQFDARLAGFVDQALELLGDPNAAERKGAGDNRP